MGEGRLLDLDTDTFEQLKPGLSAYPDDPSAAASSLDPLLKVATTVVPEELQARPRPAPSRPPHPRLHSVTLRRQGFREAETSEASMCVLPAWLLRG